MFDALLVTNTRTGDQLGKTLWLPALPSYQVPTVEWSPGEIGYVAAIAFPEGEPVAITLVGEVLDADRARFLDRGWRVLPARTTYDLPAAAGEKPYST